MNQIQLNRKDISKRIIAILDKFKDDKLAYTQLKHYLQLGTHKLMQDSMKHDSFCDYFLYPKKLPTLLLKLYGVNERELKEEMKQFHLKDYSVYDDIYYLTLMLAYLIGLDQDDSELRQYSLTLISVRIWNYYKMRFFPKTCNPEIARYVITYELQGNHTFKKHGTPFGYILKLSVPALEAKYPQEIAKNPMEQYSGLKRIITTLRSRYNQLLKGIAEAYYNAHKEGKKESVGSIHQESFDKNSDMVERQEHFSGIIERVTDKVQKNAVLKSKVLSKNPAKDFLFKKFYISNSVIDSIDTWLDDEENDEDLKYFIELVIAGAKPKKEEELCSLNIEVLANKISSSRKDENFQKAKELVAGITKTIFDKRGELSTQLDYRYRKIVMVSLLTYIKLLLCKSL
jgi:hypothetical protein